VQRLLFCDALGSLQVQQIGFLSHGDPYAVLRGGCLEFIHCNGQNDETYMSVITRVSLQPLPSVYIAT